MHRHADGLQIAQVRCHDVRLVEHNAAHVHQFHMVHTADSTLADSTLASTSHHLSFDVVVEIFAV